MRAEALAAAALVAALVGTSTGGCMTRPGTAAEAPLQVYAAASLAGAFADIAEAFEETHPGGRVLVVTAGSQTLAAQIARGAPADVFASAHAEHVQDLAAQGIVVGQRPFARSELVIAVAAGNPRGIRDLRDLAGDVDVVLCAEPVPCGRYAGVVLERAAAAWGDPEVDRLRANVVSTELDVRQAAAKVALGEADAAIVYAPDVTGDLAAELDAVEIGPDLQVSAAYWIASNAEAGPAAATFIDFVLGIEGQAVLARHGFAAPGSEDGDGEGDGDGDGP